MLAVFLPLTVLAESAMMGPMIEGYGPSFELQDGDVPLRPGFKYRVAFDAATYPGEVTDLNRELTTVARFLNMHARSGVSAEDLDVVVVLHGETLKSALNNDAYSSRYDTDNPNLDLLMKLHEAGVTFYACGQSLGFRNFDRSELVAPVKIALSAMTALTYLQSDGYAFFP